MIARTGIANVTRHQPQEMTKPCEQLKIKARCSRRIGPGRQHSTANIIPIQPLHCFWSGKRKKNMGLSRARKTLIRVLKEEAT